MPLAETQDGLTYLCAARDSTDLCDGAEWEQIARIDRATLEQREGTKDANALANAAVAELRWAAFYGGAGRPFAQHPYTQVLTYSVVVRQWGGLDI